MVAGCNGGMIGIWKRVLGGNLHVWNIIPARYSSLASVRCSTLASSDDGFSLLPISYPMHPSLKHKQCRTCIVAPFSYTAAATTASSLKHAASTKSATLCLRSRHLVQTQHHRPTSFVAPPLVEILGIKLASIHSPLIYKSGYITIDLFFSHKMFFSYLFFFFFFNTTLTLLIFPRMSSISFSGPMSCGCQVDPKCA